MPRAAAPATSFGRRVRCAIYTRKSSEEGLEQDYNSLDAQRDACEAYVRSQLHEGWVVLPAMYDDGGISGATLARPAMQRLLADIEAGGVDTVVVYKVDRLTRSLGDFAKIVEVFDRRGVSFVSVTQQFNTTTSMGRLTLNMLLSFAQFEREVTGERIRDKIAASKRKGLWMGGNPSLGYDVMDRKLVVNEAEAETVRHIYRRYVALGSVRALQEELVRDGIVSKRRVSSHGEPKGGKPLVRGALYLLLQNRIYRGEIVHKDASYPGEHPAIVDEALWEAVQRTLAANRHEREIGPRATEPSMLAGLLYDENGERLVPSHANKKGVRYRYYVSQSLLRGPRSASERGYRIPAAELDQLVSGRLRDLLADRHEVLEAVGVYVISAAEVAALPAKAQELAREWPTLGASERRTRLAQLGARAVLGPESVRVELSRAGLRALLTASNDTPAPRDERTEPLSILIPARLKRVGMEMRMVVDGPSKAARRAPDRSLHRLLAQAQRYGELLLDGSGRTMRELASEAGVTRSYLARVARLAFLAPSIVGAILMDEHPLALNGKALASNHRLPMKWNEQKFHLGF